VLGVWSGESGVHFARAYRLRDSGRIDAPPVWLAGGASTVTAEVAPDDARLYELMGSAIRAMASAQEIHYSSHMTYTTDISSLTAFEQPDGITVDFVGGTPRGWAAVFTHPAVDRVCGLAYGFDIPPGWTPGMVMCGPVAGSVGEEG
jgi:hypothetical protein